MTAASFTFVAELNDFLPPSQRRQTIQVEFKQNPAVKHLIEALGVPHPEVNQIVVNQATLVDFSYPVQAGDQLMVYPASASDARFPGRPIIQPDEAAPRFVLDGHLGKLAVYLRILGFDVFYENEVEDEYLAEVAARENCILLTRDRRLLMRKVVEYGYCLRSLDPKTQLMEVLHRYQLNDQIQPFKRCLRCNQLLEPVEKAEILDRLEPLTKLYYDQFHFCPSCDQIYWKGSHYEHMLAFLDELEHK